MKDLSTELSYRTSRSSGAGGQNVNKVATRVEVLFNVDASSILTDEEKALLRTKIATRIDTTGVLHMTCQETRSQLKNKEIVTNRFHQLIEKALKKDKVRKPSKTPKGVIQARRDSKKANSEKKQTRTKIKLYHL